MLALPRVHWRLIGRNLAGQPALTGSAKVANRSPTIIAPVEVVWGFSMSFVGQDGIQDVILPQQDPVHAVYARKTKKTNTPVTETYIQIGNVQCATLRWNWNLPLKLK